MAAANDPYGVVVGDDDYIKVSCGDDADFMEFPKEEDNSVMFSTIQTQYPDAIGLKYKGSSGAWRAIRAVDNVLAAPKGGWGERVYCITVSDTKKRKGETLYTGVESKVSRPSNPLLKDMAVIGLPFKTTNEELKEYFETNYGELGYCEVKFDRATGKSRGFGFIRFKDIDSAKEAVNGEHYLMGRKVEVRPKQDKPMKMFIGRLPHGTTKEDLETHFSKFGELRDVYIPTPFRNFAFITYASTEDGRNVLRESHVLDGSKLNVEERKPDKNAAGNENDRSFGNRTNSSFGGGYRTQDYNPRDSEQTRQPRNDNEQNRQPRNDNEQTRQPRNDNEQATKNDMASDLKTMLFQYLTTQN